MIEPNCAICMLTSAHSDKDPRIFHKEARTLSSAGYKVILVVPADRDKCIDGIQIKAVTRRKGRVNRWFRTVREVYCRAKEVNASVYHFHDPELILVGLLLKLRGHKVIYDIHEDVPRQVLRKEWIPKWLRKIVSWTVNFVETISVRAFDALIVATPGIAQRFTKSHTIVVQNFPMTSDFDLSDPLPYQDRLALVTYIGSLTRLRGIPDIINAMDLLPEHLNAKLVLAGRFSPPELEHEVRKLPGWRHVEYKGWVDKNEVVDLLGKSRCGIFTVHPMATHNVHPYPTKMFEYMVAGLPTITSDHPLRREVFSDKCTIFVNPSDVQEIAAAIERVLDDPEGSEQMGRLGRAFACNKYNWSSEQPKLLGLYEKILS